MTMIKKENRVPLLDIGTVKLIKAGRNRHSQWH